jgi:carboxylesterase type B
MLDMVRFSNRLRCDTEKEATNSLYDEQMVSEDCLYLNVWVPASQDTKRKPILVWIYGGGFAFGSTSDPRYDGARLASVTGCVVVSIAYRVSLFGFLGSRYLANVECSDSGTGNYGLWDVVTGLEWVQENAAAFGGDPENVTAFGESAGSIILHYLMLSPAVPADLFVRVGLFSGTAASVLPRSMHSVQATYDALAKALGARDDASEEQKYALLMSKSSQELQDAWHTIPSVRPRTEYVVDHEQGRPEHRCDHDPNAIRFEPSSLCGPTWDGVMVSEYFLNCLATNTPPQGKLRNGYNGIFFGHTADEGSVFTTGIGTMLGLKRSLNLCHPSMRTELETVYGVNAIMTDDAAFAVSSAILGDYVFVVPVNTLTAIVQKQSDQVPAYRYLWTHRPSRQLLKSAASNSMVEQFFSKAGSYHSGELAYLFGWDGTSIASYARQSYPDGNAFHTRMMGEFRKGHNVGFTDAERALSNAFAKLFGSFAHGQQPWTRVKDGSLSEAVVMSFDDMPSIGTMSEEARAKTSGRKDEDTIAIYETSLGNTLVWKGIVDPQQSGAVGTLEDKVVFWSEDGMRRTLLYYYGDGRYNYVA